MMFCEITDLETESDLEQKLLMPMLSSELPQGLGFHLSEIATKCNIKKFKIGKGSEGKLYYPDYCISLRGLPVIIVEAKRPGSELTDAQREARLYSNELNSGYAPNVNPVKFIITSNGMKTILSTVDSEQILVELDFKNISPIDPSYSKFLSLCSRKSLEKHANDILKQREPKPFTNALQNLGGYSVRNEEVGHNTFGNTLSINFSHIFNPRTIEERAKIARDAYVSSKRRERYLDPIEKIIRKSVKSRSARELEDSSLPKEIFDKFQDIRSLEHQVMILIGGVGSGKTTFVDRIIEVNLPSDLKKKTVWVRVDMNSATLERDSIYGWILTKIINLLKAENSDLDFDDLTLIEKVYAKQINSLKKGSLRLLANDLPEYNRELYRRIKELEGNSLETAQSFIRFLCGDRGKLFVLVLDNCDKRTRDEQLLMFQVAQWLQDELVCLVFLPIRDATYDNHRQEPPLDTVIPDCIFRIEPPKFADLIRKRLSLILKEIKDNEKDGNENKNQIYRVETGAKIIYKTDDRVKYLDSIVKSLFETNTIAKELIIGLAGRDMREALRIFLEFCTSGHIDAGFIYRIRHSPKPISFPDYLILRVLMRSSKRFYNGESSYIKNLFQCNLQDPSPSHFLRLSILRILEKLRNETGTSGLKGYHSCQDMLLELTLLGFDRDAAYREIQYFVHERLIYNEHQKLSIDDEHDLISISPSGLIHLSLLKEIQYLSTCAEDIYFSSERSAKSISDRIKGRKIGHHFSVQTVIENSIGLIEYLDEAHDGIICNNYFDPKFDIGELTSLTDSKEAIDQMITRHPVPENWTTLENMYAIHSTHTGQLVKITDDYWYIKLSNDVIGRASIRYIPDGILEHQDHILEFKLDLQVKITRLEKYGGSIRLDILRFS